LVPQPLAHWLKKISAGTGALLRAEGNIPTAQ
jgi:hypothetical protein